jgi:arylsulfatase
MHSEARGDPPLPLMRNGEVIEQPAVQETLTRRYTEEAIRFIEENRGRPFFLYLAHTFPHVPLHVSERFRGKSPRGLYGDVVEELDWSVGEVLGALRKHGLEENTLVLFSSDNGPWYQGSPGRLRGRKGMTWEGGVRVPFLARWPGRVRAGIAPSGVASAMDMVPTVARLCGADLPSKPLDGIDIWPILSEGRNELEREALLYFDHIWAQCARWRQWKLHFARYSGIRWSPEPPGGRINLPLANPELYNVVEDPDESYDVAPENPRIVKEILARVERLMQTFPEPIRQAHAETKARKTVWTAVGNVPRAAP